jgi:hypothetical protein
MQGEGKKNRLEEALSEDHFPRVVPPGLAIHGTLKIHVALLGFQDFPSLP